jgi:dTDP-glucose pyrophosphorylase/predicted transcriptional regulator
VTEISWKKCILSPDNSVRDAIDNLIASSKRIVLVVSEDERFLGTISDGDIRRGLLRGIGLESRLSEIIQRAAIVAPPEMPRDVVKQLMLTHKIQQIPIINSSNQLQGLLEWDYLDSAPERNNLFVVMAGGEGRRLLPHTLNTPKPMVLIHGKPILEHIILRARADGFFNFVVVAHHFSHVIEKYFGDGSKWEVSIKYVIEDKPLGTAGGLHSLLDVVSEPIIVSNGDVLSDLVYSDLLQFHLDTGSSATMAVRQYEFAHPFGVVSIEGSRITLVQEKPVFHSFINAGIYAISKESLLLLERNSPMSMTELFEKLRVHDYLVSAFPIYESWIDIGNPHDLQLARREDTNE